MRAGEAALRRRRTERRFAARLSKQAPVLPLPEVVECAAISVQFLPCCSFQVAAN